MMLEKTNNVIVRRFCMMKEVNEHILVYHGGSEIIMNPEIRIDKYAKDFYFGFYCTILPTQAERWAMRNINKSIVNVYKFTSNSNLNIKYFNEMTDEWLDFIAMCRNGGSHGYDIVEGPMADDVIYNYVQDFIDKKISRSAFWELAKFKYPTHQISFHSARALESLTYERSYSL